MENPWQHLGWPVGFLFYFISLFLSGKFKTLELRASRFHMAEKGLVIGQSAKFPKEGQVF